MHKGVGIIVCEAASPIDVLSHRGTVLPATLLFDGLKTRRGARRTGVKAQSGTLTAEPEANTEAAGHDEQLE